MPPLYHRVWQYLKYKVNHKKRKIPMKDGTFLEILPGQHLTSIRDIAKNVGWYEGVKWKQPNPKSIKSILDWLEKQLMISVDTGNRQYTLITLINWEIYQSKDDEGNSGVLEENEEITVKGNSKETEKTLIYKGLNEEDTVSSNSKETAREQCVDINKNDQECIKNDLYAVDAVISDEKNEGLEGMPFPQDAVPTPETGADSTQKKISKSDYQNMIRDKYLQRRAKGTDLSSMDELAIEEIMAEKIPLSTVLAGIDKAFDEYKPKHARDSIKSLNYCVPIIFDLHYLEIAKEAKRNEASRTSPSRIGHRKPKTANSKDSITGGQVGWINRKRA